MSIRSLKIINKELICTVNLTTFRIRIAFLMILICIQKIIYHLVILSSHSTVIIYSVVKMNFTTSMKPIIFQLLLPIVTEKNIFFFYEISPKIIVILPKKQLFPELLLFLFKKIAGSKKTLFAAILYYFFLSLLFRFSLWSVCSSIPRCEWSGRAKIIRPASV